MLLIRMIRYQAHVLLLKQQQQQQLCFIFIIHIKYSLLCKKKMIISVCSKQKKGSLDASMPRCLCRKVPYTTSPPSEGILCQENIYSVHQRGIHTAAIS